VKTLEQIRKDNNKYDLLFTGMEKTTKISSELRKMK